MNNGILAWLFGWLIGHGSAPAPAPAPVPVVPAPVPVVPPPGPGPRLTQVITLVNRARARYALGPLTGDFALSLACQRHSVWMARLDLMRHQFPGEPNPGARDATAGYRWSAEGECVAAGYPDAASVVAGWLADPPHRAILLGPYRQVGVGVAASARGTLYWTADLGSPAP